MSDDELKALDLLAQAWNVYEALPVLHHADKGEFLRAIHAAQNIILAREGLRTTGVIRPQANLPMETEAERRVWQYALRGGA